MKDKPWHCKKHITTGNSSLGCRKCFDDTLYQYREKVDCRHAVGANITIHSSQPYAGLAHYKEDADIEFVFCPKCGVKL